MSSPFKQFTITYQPGEHIYGEGERGASMFIVQSGAIRLFRQGNGGTVELGVMEKGDFFGEMVILEGGTRRHSAAAIEPTVLIEINAATFDAMIRRNMEIAIRMLRKLSSRLRRAEQALASRPDGPVAAEAASSVIAPPAPDRSAVPAPTLVPPRAAPPEPAPPRDDPAPPVAGDSTATDGPEVEPCLILEGNESQFSVSGDEALIGRYDPVTEIQPEVDLTEVDLKRSVSRRHARIARRDGAFFLIEEVGALNGTFLNGKKLVPGKPNPLSDGDTLTLGTVRLVFRCG
jgi:hypothetical protein